MIVYDVLSHRLLLFSVLSCREDATAYDACKVKKYYIFFLH